MPKAFNKPRAPHAEHVRKASHQLMNQSNGVGILRERAKRRRFSVHEAVKEILMRVSLQLESSVDVLARLGRLSQVRRVRREHSQDRV